MTENEMEFVERVLDAFNENPQKVSEWEKRFMDDQVTRFQKYGVDMYMSTKQWEIFRRVSEKLEIE